MDKLLSDVANRAYLYLKRINTRSVFPADEAIKNLDNFDFSLPVHPTNPQDVIKKLDEVGSPATVTSNGGRYYGFVIGASLPATLGSSWLASAWDQNAAFSVSSPVSAKLEEVALGWIYFLLDLPKCSAGTFVTGTTMANFTALAAARYELLKNLNWDVREKGLFNAPPIKIVLSEEAHPTILKAVSLLGMGQDNIIWVPTDSQGRVRLSKFPRSNNAIICCQAGNVNSGSFDQINEICDISNQRNVWIHVDGAFGLWVRASKNYEYLATGIEKADSWATDLHKWLNVPYDNGIAVIRNADALKNAMALTAAYLPDGENREPFYYTPEVSRKGRGIDAWAALYSLGQQGLSDLINRTCHYAKLMAKKIKEAGYSILNDVVINQVLVSFGESEKTLKIIDAVQKEGTCWCGGTIWKGKTAMRISISSHATTEEDIYKSVDAILKVARLFN